MSRTSDPLLQVILAVVLSLVLPGCTGQDGSRSSLLLARSSLNGDWIMSLDTVTDDCGGFPGAVFPVHYRIEQAADSLVVTRFPVCYLIGEPNLGVVGTGSVVGAAVTFSLSQSDQTDPACTRQIIEVASGIFDGVKIKGETTTGVTGAGDCGTGLPCRIVSRFTMQRCSGGSCSTGVLCSNLSLR